MPSTRASHAGDPPWKSNRSAINHDEACLPRSLQQKLIKNADSLGHPAADRLRFAVSWKFFRPAGRRSKRISDQFQCFYFDRGSARECCALFSPGNRRHFIFFGKAARQGLVSLRRFCLRSYIRSPSSWRKSGCRLAPRRSPMCSGIWWVWHQAWRQGVFLRGGVDSGSRSLRLVELVPLSILILWLLTESLPLAPTLDWQKIKDALKPLLEFNSASPGA